MNFFETLIHPDREENSERAEISRAANILQVGEFQLLMLAHADWFGHDMTEEAVNRLFAAYMLKDRVPHWARHYARSIIARDHIGAIDDRDPAYHRYDPADTRTRLPDGVRRFCVAAMVVVLCVFGSVWIGHLTTGPGTSLLPPYFDPSELQRHD